MPERARLSIASPGRSAQVTRSQEAGVGQGDQPAQAVGVGGGGGQEYPGSGLALLGGAERSPQ